MSAVTAAPAAAAPAVAGDAAAPAQAAQGGMMNMLSMAMRVFILYSFVKWLFGSSAAPTQRAVTITTADGRSVTTMQSSQVAPAWQSGQHFDIHVYVNNDADWTADSLYGSSASSAELIPYLDTHLLWHEDDIAYEAEGWDSAAVRELNATLIEPFVSQLLANQSLYAHIYISKHDTPHSPALSCKRAAELSGYVSPCSRDSGRLSSMHAVQRLNEYKPPPKIDTRKNLITGDRADKGNTQQDNTSLTTTTAAGSLTVASDVPAPLWVNYWKPTLHIRLLHDFTVYPSTNTIPPEMKDNYRVDSATSSYLPVLYIDYFWLLSSHHMQINTSVSSLPLILTYSPIGQFKYRGELSMEQSWRMQQQMGTHSEADTEMFKKIVLESNPYLLAVTMIVSCLHMLFDMLAFKNDISFWRNNKSTAGLSGRAVVMNTAMQAVIFLYLLDNETSWMILFSCGMGLLIECWKIPKLFKVKVDAVFPFVHLTPVAVQTDAEGVGLTEQDKLMQLTHKYDREAMTYLAYALYPLVGCYAIYSVFYQTHKSWYSFVLSTLVGSVYTFGFINMCPQLYLNYKLKSVAAMPWRQMTYKALNTVIDDLFAFVITMPTLHRLSVFRDDIIFLIFLYQRWIYREDRMRTNEFGVSGVDLEMYEARVAERSKEAGTGQAVVAPVGTAVTAVRDEEKKEVRSEAEAESVALDKNDIGEQRGRKDLRQRRVAVPETSSIASG